MISGRIKHNLRGIPVELEWETEGETLEERISSVEWDAILTLDGGARYDALEWMSGADCDSASDAVHADVAEHWRTGGRG